MKLSLKFLQQENALENNRFLVDAIKIHIKSGLLDTMLALPEITKETIELAVTSWGSEVVYDFIEATGLLDVKCKSRYKLVPALVDQIKKQQNEKTPFTRNTTISVGGQNTAQPVPGVRPAQKK